MAKVLTVRVKPELITWAIERSRRDPAVLADKFPLLERWRLGEVQPTLKQLERLAAATHAPIGYFFLNSPPQEELPIPDFRTIGSRIINRPSPDLLATIHLCQQRQDWYQQYALLFGEEPKKFIGSATLQSDVVATARQIRKTISFDLDARAAAHSVEDALRMMFAAADDAGVLVMASGIVGSNTHRPLDTGEFRGFALSDQLAPLIFINGTDSKSGQMFTLAHELAHLWLGQSALTNATAAGGEHGTRSASRSTADVEAWCNAVAAEMLVPMESFRVIYRPGVELHAEKRRLSNHYKVSTLVILRRMLDAGGLTRQNFDAAFTAELTHLRSIMATRKEASKGGDPYATGRVRLSSRFAKAVLASTWEGRSTFTEAFRLLGFRSVQTLERFGDSLGMSDYLRSGAV